MNSTRRAVMRKARIVHVTSALDPGGIETWLSRVVRAPGGAELVSGVIVLSPREGLLAPLFRARAIPIHCLPVEEGPAAFACSMARLLRRTGPWDIVHSHVHRRTALVHAGAILAGVPVRISHSHNTKGQEDSHGRPLQGVLKWVATGWMNLVSHARIACSQNAATALFGSAGDISQDPRSGRVLGGSENRAVHCMPYGLDLDAFLHAGHSPVTRESLRISQDALVIGHVGRFMEQKNHAFLLKVAAEAIRKESRLHFLLVGDGVLRTVMEARARELGIGQHVSFTGNRLDVPSLMRHCMDCFFLPSLWEGLGIVLLEAQAAGLSCVFSDAVPPEANRLPERNRVFRLSSQPAEVADILIETLVRRNVDRHRQSDPRQFIGTIEENVRDLAEIYESALQHPGLAPVLPLRHVAVASGMARVRAEGK